MPILFSLSTGYGAFFFFAPETRSAEPEGFIGSANCQTSGCHGGAGDLSKQYTIWFRADAHSRAHSTLTTARSLRMAETLGIQDPVRSQRCTSCHAPFTSLTANRHSQARPEEGVSCESCHGPAQAWVRSHTRKDYTKAQRISSGMRDLEDLYLRSNTCVACHQILPQDLADAGHPRLHFDLAELSRLQPPHWRELWDGPQLWAVGQFSSLRESSGTLAQNPKAGAYALADWESSLWLCRLILKTLPAKTESQELSSPSRPDKTFTQTCDRLAKQEAGIRWQKEWNRLLLLEFIRQLPTLSEGHADETIFRLKLQKIHSGICILAGEMPSDRQVLLAPLLQKLAHLQTQSQTQIFSQLSSISQHLLRALDTDL